MKKRTIGKKTGALISIMLIAVMIICAACSSSDPDIDPDDITVISDSESKVTTAPEPTSSPKDNDIPSDNNTDIDNGNDDTGIDDVPYEPDDNENIDNGDIDDNYPDDSEDNGDSNDENLPPYGTYAYKPEGQIPFFAELTLDSLFSSQAEQDAVMDDIVAAYKQFCIDTNREYEPLDPSSVGSTPKTLWGIYYRVTDPELDRLPFDEVEEWLVMFEGGVYALYDKGFKNILKSGALMQRPDNDWQTFSVDEDGSINVLWEFNGDDISCNFGYFERAFELWDYDSEGAGTSDSDYIDDSDASDLSMYFCVDPMTEFFTMDVSLFGLSYKEFKNLLGISDLMQPEDWPWWGKNLKVVYVGDEYDTYACFFQNNSLVTVYRDAPSEGPGAMYYGATLEYGDPDREYAYWNGTTAYEWQFNECYYRQYTESYSEGDMHYRQQYMSYEFEE